ncbi:hypothetical protein ACET3Z_032537 [Daucus carota]
MKLFEILSQDLFARCGLGFSHLKRGQQSLRLSLSGFGFLLASRWTSWFSLLSDEVAWHERRRILRLERCSRVITDSISERRDPDGFTWKAVSKEEKADGLDEEPTCYGV